MSIADYPGCQSAYGLDGSGCPAGGDWSMESSSKNGKVLFSLEQAATTAAIFFGDDLVGAPSVRDSRLYGTMI